MTSTRRLALLLALAGAGCGKYANVAQKLDVTARVAGDTWITAVDPTGGTNRTEVRLLVVGKPDANGAAPFAFSALELTHARGDSVWTLQGTWVETGTSDATAFVAHTYLYPDESGKRVLERTGTTRDDEAWQIPLKVSRSAHQLVVSGDARLAGTYVPFTEALANLQTATAADAACAFHVANLGLLRSQGRMIGFGGPGITQYQQAADYIGTISGSLEISAQLTGGFPPDHSHVVVAYHGFEDVGGAIADGPMITDADSTGSGAMSGVVGFRFAPIAADGTPGAPIAGTIDYGATAVQIVNGDAIGGGYTIAFEGGGGTALVPPESVPSPPVSVCLALP